MSEQQETRPFQQINTIIAIILIAGFAYYLFFEEPTDSKLGTVQRLAQNTVTYFTTTTTELISGTKTTADTSTQSQPTYKPQTYTRQSNSNPPAAQKQAAEPIRPVYDASKAEVIISQAELTYEMYQKCSQRLAEYNSKINLVRDQGTLYQWDGNVNNCIEVYIERSQKLAILIQEDGKHVNKENLQLIRDVTLQSSQNLYELSYLYSQLSASRHQYIHQTYQTNSLINLGILIGESVGAISAGDAPGSISSLSDVYGWWYYNGGVIDTGWSQ